MRMAQTFNRKGELIFSDKNRTLHLTSDFLNDWKRKIESLKDGKRKDKLMAQYLLCHKMYKIGQPKKLINA